MNSLVSRLWCCVLQTGYKRCLTSAAAANTPTKVLPFCIPLCSQVMEHCNSRQAETVQVGFIGLGNMGSRMAKNLLHGGHELLVYDTSTTKLRAFCKDTGVASAASPSAVAAEAGEQAPACAWLLSEVLQHPLVASVTLGRPVRRRHIHNAPQLRARERGLLRQQRRPLSGGRYVQAAMLLRAYWQSINK